MKKILLLALLFCLSKSSFAQYPNGQQSMGNDSNVVYAKGGLKGRMIIWSFTDTTAANLQRIKDYTGSNGSALIFCTSDSSLYSRWGSGWFKLGGAGGGATGSFYNLTGNYLPVTPAGLGVGFNDPYNVLNFKTNNLVRVVLPVAGLERQVTTGAFKYMLFDTTSKTWGYGDGGSGATPTWQQTLTAGSTLTGNNTITGGGYNWTWNNSGTQTFNLAASKNFTINNPTASSYFLFDPATAANPNSEGYLEVNGASYLAATQRMSVTGTSAINFLRVNNFTTSRANEVYISKDSITLSSLITNVSISQIEIKPSAITIRPNLNALYVDSLAYTLSTVGKKIMLRDTATGLVQNIDPALLSAGTVPISSLTAATVDNGIDNVAFRQDWGWSGALDTYGIGFAYSGTTALNNTSVVNISLTGTNGAASRTHIGLDISASNDGTTSTNIGLRSAAQSGTNNYAIIVPASGGSVGIGTSAPTSLLHVNGVTQMGTAGSTLGQLLMSGNTSGTVTLKTLAAAGTYSLTLPPNDGGAGEFLQTDGSGVLTWAAAAGGSGITSINSLTPTAQTLAVGTAGTDFAINSATATHTFNLPTASGSNRGALSTSDWTTFNNKVPTTTSISTGYGLTGGGDFSTNRTHILDSATLYITALRRKDSLTATNLLGYVTKTSLHDSIDALGDIIIDATAVPLASASGTDVTIKSLADGTNIDVVNTSSTVATVNITGAIGAANGGTGIANNAAATVTSSGNFAYTRTLTGTTNVTFPVSGTLATLAGTEAFTNKTYNGNTFTAGTGVLTIGAAKTATFNNTLSFSGTDATVMTFPTTSATIARTDAANTFTGVQSMTSPDITTSITTPSTTFALVNTTATTVNAFGAATTLNIGASAATVLNFGGSTSAAELRFLEPSGSGTNYTGFKAQAQAGNITYTLPAADGSPSQFLQTNGSGSLTWTTPAGSGDVTKVGTPVDNQIGVWTGNGTIEGTTDFTFASSTLSIGVNTTTLGKVKMFGNTSGDATIQPPAVAGTATVLTLPSVTGTLATLAGTETFTNKRWTARVGSTTSSATPTINTDNTDIYKITAQTEAITSFTTNLSGTPVDGDVIEIQITGTAARAITWGASFVSSTVTLPTTTVTTATLSVLFQYFTTSSYGNNKWVCVNSF